MDRTINDLLCTTQSYNLSVIAFSLPNESAFTIYIQDSLSDQKSVDNKEFWIAPFHSSTNFPFVKIRPQFILQETDEIPFFERRMEKNAYWTIQNKTFESFSENRYVSSVEQLQKKIQEGKLKKAAISQLQEIDLSPDFHIWNYLKSIRQEYKNAFVSFISTPFTGTWIGATPELLLESNESTLKTVALAGTIMDDGISEWTEKEKIEQDFVSQHVSEVLESLEIGELETSNLNEIRIGHLIHLIKKFSLKNITNISKQTIEKVANALHPTPAVGGFPKIQAIEYIKEVEKYNRSYYAGFLGPVDLHHAALFVNLRCMSLCPKTAFLFGGAGVTAESVPANEWKETNNKIQVLQRLIKQVIPQ